MECFSIWSIGILSVIYLYFPLSAVYTVGSSMHPTIGDLSLIIFYSSRQPVEKGDVLILADPITDALIAKRVIGVAGDSVNFQSGVITILPTDVFSKLLTTKIWLEGDAGCGLSRDSRTFGPVKTSRVYGKVICMVYRFYRIQIWPVLKWL
jgi:signal peptidase I